MKLLLPRSMVASGVTTAIKNTMTGPIARWRVHVRNHVYGFLLFVSVGLGLKKINTRGSERASEHQWKGKKCSAC